MNNNNANADGSINVPRKYYDMMDTKIVEMFSIIYQSIQEGMTDPTDGSSTVMNAAEFRSSFYSGILAVISRMTILQEESLKRVIDKAKEEYRRKSKRIDN